MSFSSDIRGLKALVKGNLNGGIKDFYLVTGGDCVNQKLAPPD